MHPWSSPTAAIAAFAIIIGARHGGGNAMISSASASAAFAPPATTTTGRPRRLAARMPRAAVTKTTSPSGRGMRVISHAIAVDGLSSSSSSDDDDGRRTTGTAKTTPRQSPFSLPTALFLAGLAFDAYVEPPPSSSRWERGSSGLNVAFLSGDYTRSLYRGLIEVTPLRASDLPDEDDAAESLMTGGGVDAALLVSVVEGAWTEDVTKLEREQYHDGVLDLAGCAHVGRSSTAWGNVDEAKARQNKKRGGSGAYHVKSSWGRGGQAVWEGDPPFYLYVQEPEKARLVFTLFDEDVVGGGTSIGSAHRKLVELLPDVAKKTANDETTVARLKSEVIDRLRKSGRLQDAISVRTDPQTGIEETVIDEDVVMEAINESYGSGTTASIKMSSKPRKKDKGGQRAIGMAAGAMIAGPAGAAVGGILASMYEGEVRGKVEVGLRYTPIPRVDLRLSDRRTRYRVKGGLPGVEWGELYERHVGGGVVVDDHGGSGDGLDAMAKPPTDLEFCCFVTHDDTGCSCAVYRSLERRLICVSFRGTCAPKDLVTDATITQSAWVEGEDVEIASTAKVHAGFRNSLDSISRRLKELVLAAVAPGDDLANYDLLVTGHSLGGALATCFVADVAEYGMDAGRGLPQLAPSEAWWNGIASTFLAAGRKAALGSGPPPPPRPRSLKMYNFGSPRVGNDAFCAKFDAMVESGAIDEAYRIVNGQDVVARTPRTVNALVLGNIGYNHCGPTVLITESIDRDDGDDNIRTREMLWIEGQSDDAACPVRDGSFTDRGFAEREMKLLQSIFSGEGLSHHMEDKYYQGMGASAGFAAFAGSELVTLEEFKTMQTKDVSA